MLVSFSWNSSGLLFSLGLNLVGETGGKSFIQLEVLYVSSQRNVVCMYKNDEFFSWQLLNDTKMTHSQLKLQFHKKWYDCISQDWSFNSLFLTFILLFSFYSLHIFQLFFFCLISSHAFCSFSLVYRLVLTTVIRGRQSWTWWFNTELFIKEL